MMRTFAVSTYRVLEALLEFAERFQDFDKISDNMKLVASHLVETESAPLDFQMELIELKKNNAQLVK